MITLLQTKGPTICQKKEIATIRRYRIKNDNKSLIFTIISTHKHNHPIGHRWDITYNLTGDGRCIEKHITLDGNQESFFNNMKSTFITDQSATATIIKSALDIIISNENKAIRMRNPRTPRNIQEKQREN